jgi:hypothetical protein
MVPDLRESEERFFVFWNNRYRKGIRILGVGTMNDDYSLLLSDKTRAK